VERSVPTLRSSKSGGVCVFYSLAMLLDHEPAAVASRSVLGASQNVTRKASCRMRCVCRAAIPVPKVVLVI
jgi:hypothetical protein